MPIPATAGQRRLERGWASLLREHGEPLDFRGATVPAVVRRDTPSELLPGVRLNFTERKASLIELQVSLLNGDAPEAGEYFTDGTGSVHRVSETITIGNWYKVFCAVTN